MWKNQIKNGLIIILLGIIAFGYYWIDKDKQVDESIVARVNNKQITEQELVEELKSLYGKEVLEDLINRKVIKQSAEKYDIKASKTAVDRQYNELLQSYKDEEEFIDYLNEQLGWTKQQLIEYIEYNILWEKIATKDVEITDAQLLEYYQKNQEYYYTPERLHIEQIIVATAEEANQVIDELKNGSNFNTLAKERSLDVFSLGTGGDIGFVSADDPNVDIGIINKASGMKINEVAIAEVADGFAIIRLLERKAAVQHSFEEVKEEVRRELALNQVSSLPEVLEQLKAEMKVEILDSKLK